MFNSAEAGRNLLWPDDTTRLLFQIEADAASLYSHTAQCWYKPADKRFELYQWPESENSEFR